VASVDKERFPDTHPLKTMRTPLTSLPRSVLHLAAAVPVLALAIAGILPHLLGLVLGVSLAIAGLWHLAQELVIELKRRREADRLLVVLETTQVPDNLRWRARELTRARERRLLARALRNLVRSLELPPAMYPVPVNRRALRRNRPAIEELAARLAQVDRPVRPRGVLLRRQLLGGSPHSPLYDSAAAAELPAALAHVRSEIEPR
jgi:hypothetical protein